MPAGVVRLAVMLAELPLLTETDQDVVNANDTDMDAVVKGVFGL